MAITYSTTAINYRLLGVVTALGSSGRIVLRQGSTTISTIFLSNPCGTVADGVLTFFTGVDLGAANTGTINNVLIENSAGTIMISDLTVGIPTSGREFIISNGFNTTVISAGQTVALVGAQIVGS